MSQIYRWKVQGSESKSPAMCYLPLCWFHELLLPPRSPSWRTVLISKPRWLEQKYWGGLFLYWTGIFSVNFHTTCHSSVWKCGQTWPAHSLLLWREHKPRAIWDSQDRNIRHVPPLKPKTPHRSSLHHLEAAKASMLWGDATCYSGERGALRPGPAAEVQHTAPEEVKNCSLYSALHLRFHSSPLLPLPLDARPRSRRLYIHTSQSEKPSDKICSSQQNKTHFYAPLQVWVNVMLWAGHIFTKQTSHTKTNHPGFLFEAVIMTLSSSCQCS